MDKIITGSSLFKNCPEHELGQFITEAPCRRTDFKKGSLLMKQGDAVHAAGLLLSGSVKAFHTSLNGEECIHNVLLVGDMFGQVLMASEKDESPVSIEALEDTSVLFIPMQAILTAKGKCGDILRVNLLHILSARCWQLTQQVSFLSEKTVRGRIAGYLLRERKKSGSDTFMLPLNREALSQLLCVNRSALSRELSALRKEGLIDFYKSSFRLRNISALASYCEHS